MCLIPEAATQEENSSGGTGIQAEALQTRQAETPALSLLQASSAAATAAPGAGDWAATPVGVVTAGALVGIGAGASVALALAGVTAALLYRRKRRRALLQRETVPSANGGNWHGPPAGALPPRPAPDGPAAAMLDSGDGGVLSASGSRGSSGSGAVTHRTWAGQPRYLGPPQPPPSPLGRAPY
jgi:hypothetical protein